MIRLLSIACSCVILFACSEDSPQPPVAATSSVEATAAKTDSVAARETAAGGVTVTILPENPTSNGCLRAVVQGNPGRSTIVWKVNGEVVVRGTDTQLCSDFFKREDQVSVEVGTDDQGARASVTIANSQPRIVDITSTPAEIFAGTDIFVAPVAEDADGDSVDFSYQWLINGESDPLLTEATLPGNRFTKGDTVQVLIVPNDFYEDGPTYESYAQPIPNAPPRIVSEPPQAITSLDYRYQVEASDPDDSQLSFRLEEGPAGMKIDPSSGLLQWSLVEATPGEHTIAIIVSDPEGAEVAQEYTLTLSAAQ